MPRGRPKLSPELLRQLTIQVPVNPAENAQIIANARAAGYADIAPYIRDLALGINRETSARS